MENAFLAPGPAPSLRMSDPIYEDQCPFTLSYHSALQNVDPRLYQHSSPPDPPAQDYPIEDDIQTDSGTRIDHSQEQPPMLNVPIDERDDARLTSASDSSTSLTSTLFSASQNIFNHAASFFSGGPSSSQGGAPTESEPRDPSSDDDQNIWDNFEPPTIQDIHASDLLLSKALPPRKFGSPSSVVAGPSRCVDGAALKRSASTASIEHPSKRTKRDAPQALSKRASESVAGAPFIIAHDDRLVKLLDEQRIAWGTIWEIARFYTLKRVDLRLVYALKVKPLQGKNAEAAPKVAEILVKPHPPANEIESTLRQYDTSTHDAFARERAVKDPWVELDNEQEALIEDKGRGLGCFDAKSDVSHGKVQFRASVYWKGDPPQPTVCLEKPEIGPSTRFARRWGSRRFIRMKMLYVKGYKRPTHERLMDFLLQPFVILGRVFRAFYEKEGTVHLIETDENWGGRVPQMHQGDHLRISVEEFMQWHNPMELNKNQIMTKWAARFALALSTSVPGVRIELENIHRIDDIISPLFNGKGKPPSEMQMTDGCGFINGTALKMISEQIGWDHTPSAVQARFAGAKGMFMLHPNLDFDGPPAIWLRTSQVKIEYETYDPAMLIVDVVRPPHLTCPATLSAESIVVLSHCKVPDSVFINYLETGLQDYVKDFVDWNSEKAALKLWDSVCRYGGVIGSRLKQLAAGTSRAKGYGMERDEDINIVDDEDVDVVVNERSTAWWGDEISGCPSSLEETAMMALSSGFTPQNSPFLQKKLKPILKNHLESFIADHRLTVPQSAKGFILPDPLGCLKEGEIYLRMSNPAKDPRTGMHVDCVTGPVLVVRHPCKLPTDVQKVVAVDKPELRHWKDQPISSIRGTRSLASMLAGGDHDGDTVAVYWDPALVDSFQNAPVHFANLPAGISESFVRSTEQVSEFIDNSLSISSAQMLRRKQEVLISSIKQSHVGVLSNFHDVSVYLYGLADRRSVMLAYMFTTCLDGAKSGLQITPEVYSKLCKEFDKYEQPHWKNESKKAKKAKKAKQSGKQTDGDKNKFIPKFQPKFIMEQLREVGKAKFHGLLASFEESCRGTSCNIDPHLTAPWEHIDDYARRHPSTGLYPQLHAIGKHVEDVRRRHRMQMQLSVKESLKRQQSAGVLRDDERNAFTAQDITVRQDILRAFSRQFDEGPPPEQIPDLVERYGHEYIKRLKASLAYKYDWEQSKEGGTSFPFDVACRTLCEIKAHACGATVTVTQPFYDGLTLHKGYVRS